jgi:hypothetical protein
MDLVLLREGVTAAARHDLFDEARGLAAINGVLACGLVENGGASDFDLAFFFVVDSPSNLEAFGTNERYIRFLQGGLARALRAFGGADVQLTTPFAGGADYAACLAVAAPPQTYDWQVRDALASWCATAAGCMSGLAIGERQRYRGIGIMFSSEPIPRPASGFDGFGLDFISGRGRMLS